MSKRKVTIKLTSQKNAIVHESDARTFGQLKKELTNISWKGLRVVERSTKNTLDMDDALLPAGEFILFAVPEKVKSGSLKKKGLKKLKNVSEASYNDLRSHASFLNKMKDAKISLSGGTEDLRKAVQAYYDSSNKGVLKEKEEDPIVAIEAARVKINDAIDQIIQNAKTAPVDDKEYVLKVSVDDLDEELKEIKKALKL